MTNKVGLVHISLKFLNRAVFHSKCKEVTITAIMVTVIIFRL